MSEFRLLYYDVSHVNFFPYIELSFRAVQSFLGLSDNNPAFAGTIRDTFRCFRTAIKGMQCNSQAWSCMKSYTADVSSSNRVRSEQDGLACRIE
jgi:hypothetical protein